MNWRGWSIELRDGQAERGFVEDDRVSEQSQKQARAIRDRRILVFLIVVLGAAGAITSLLRLRPAQRVRRLDPASGYTNTLPAVRYVGDQACARCHAEIAETFARHPMGRSLGPLLAADLPGDAGSRSFKAEGFDYEVLERDGKVWHVETKRDTQGEVLARTEGLARFRLGSGRGGFAFLIEREGELYQSPISWYAQRKTWGLSPGYERQNVHFDRPINGSCLYCHANRARLVEHTVNRYEPPIFEGFTIGCERCHGPGEDHIAAPWPEGDRDLTIVNPARLKPALRDAVCEQCHLSGKRRVPRLARSDDDFRPGLPFHEFWAVFEPETTDSSSRFVGQVEQIRESRCAKESSGAMWCGSCHDPHVVPAPADKARYYRERCLTCHAEHGCKLDTLARQSRSNDCVACHMPRQSIVDVIHAATTNHRIPRFADRKPDEAPRAGSLPTALFHASLVDKQGEGVFDRERAIAVCRDGVAGATLAESILGRTLAQNRTDSASWEARAIALAILGRPAESIRAWKTAVEIAPASETALAGLTQAVLDSDPRLAVECGRKVVAIAPGRAEYHAMLAQAMFLTRSWSDAAKHCRQAIALNAADLDSRRLLVRTLLRLGEQAAARAQLLQLMALNPPDREDLKKRFPTLIPGSS